MLAKNDDFGAVLVILTNLTPAGRNESFLLSHIVVQNTWNGDDDVSAVVAQMFTHILEGVF